MKEKKPNWLINGGVGVAMLILILASLASPLLIYVVLVFIGFVTVANMVRIERLTLEKKIEPEEAEEKPIEPEPIETPKEEEIPDVDVVKKEYENASVKIEEYVRRNLEKGATPDEIYGVLAPSYGEELVKSILVKYIKPVEKPKTEKKEVKKPKKKTAKKEEKPEKEEEYKAEIVDEEHKPNEKE